ncbi:hypothetical protein TCAL_01451 [Tigriopus californicus]|uniref:Protein CNPPD1 n=1 Tax=Tigriopus californicus TaxID=6832 RepID=A0A553N792_TIGCA|nr:protein CNPPD1-like [Tigriopus californicus]TRY61308.1 hypothetical protein TCAL_01451 [Tigriopus californicus]
MRAPPPLPPTQAPPMESGQTAGLVWAKSWDAMTDPDPAHFDPEDSRFDDSQSEASEDWEDLQDRAGSEATEATEATRHEGDLLEEEDEEEEDLYQEFPSHADLASRFAKTLYLGSKAVVLERDSEDTEDVTEAAFRVTQALTELCVEEFGRDHPQAGLNRLCLQRAAEITSVTSPTPTALLLALLYLDRLRQKNPGYLHRISATDLFLVSMMVASKYLYDDGESEEIFVEEWATAGKMEKRDLHDLEFALLDALDWSIYVNPPDFERLAENVESRIAAREVAKRGWASYTDLVVLTRHLPMVKVWEIVAECTLKVTAVCASAYAASILTMMSTVWLLNKSPLGHTALQASLCSSNPVLVTPSPNPAAFNFSEPLDPSPEDESPQLHMLTEVLKASVIVASTFASHTRTGHATNLKSSNPDDDPTNSAYDHENGASNDEDEEEHFQRSWDLDGGNLSDLNHHSTSVLLKPYGADAEPPDPFSRALSSFQVHLNTGLKLLRRKPNSQCPWRKLSVFGVESPYSYGLWGSVF